LPPVLKILRAHTAAAAGYVIYAGFCSRIDVLLYISLQSLLAGLYVAVFGAIENRGGIIQEIARVTENGGKSILLFSALYGFGIFSYFLMLLYAIIYSTPTHVTVLLSLQPALTVAALWTLFRKKPIKPPLFCFTIILSLLGLLLYEVTSLIAKPPLTGVGGDALSLWDLLIVGVVAIAIFKAAVIEKNCAKI
jgi:drug/metabolite transporter (DMT)-like permease